MPVNSLRTVNFRNLANQEISLAPAANVLVGRNGSGKTSTLEAVYLATSLRTFRPVRIGDMIRVGCDRSQVEISSGDKDTPLRQRVEITRGGRTAWLGGRIVRRVSDYVGKSLCMAFTPDDMAMVKGPPEKRRSFIDRAIMLGNAYYLDQVRMFQKALRMRNALLRERPAGYRDLLDSYTEQLCRLAEPVTNSRLRAVEQLAPLVSQAYRDIGGSEDVTITYLSGSQRRGSGEEDLKKVLESTRKREEQLGYTSRGPQFDDLRIEICGRDTRKMASQGEQRSCALSLLIAVVEWLQVKVGSLPTLLLDDVSSELDGVRRAKLFTRLLEMGTQVLLTTTDKQYAVQLLEAQALLIEVERGVLNRCHSGH